MYKNILVPVDIADLDMSKAALAQAEEIAKISHGTVRLIYVRSILPVTFMEYVPPHFDEQQQKEAEGKLSTIAAKVNTPSGPVSYVVRMGSVYHEVLDEAERIKADLVIVGSHNPTMASYLLGSNASTIVRHAKCSVLIARQRG